jgi:putative transposase
MLLERGVLVSYETVRRWALKFGPDYARRLRRKTPSRHDVWHLDEVVVTIAGQKHWLWRAVDQDGCVLDEIVQTRRNTKAAKRLLRRLLKKQGMAPKRIITNKLEHRTARRIQEVSGWAEV